MNELQPGQKVYIVNRERVRKGLGPRSATISGVAVRYPDQSVAAWALKGGGSVRPGEAYVDQGEAKSMARSLARDEARLELKRYEAILARLNEAYKASSAE